VAGLPKFFCLRLLLKKYPTHCDEIRVIIRIRVKVIAYRNILFSSLVSILKLNLLFRIVPNFSDKAPVALFVLLFFICSGEVTADKRDVLSSSVNNQSSTTVTESSKNLPAAVQWYLELAKEGDAEAQYNLGSVYDSGFGVPVDSDEAVRWYKEAADQGHPRAQLKLGIMYILGEGTRQSLINGTRWVRNASEGGNTFATLLYDKVLSPDVSENVSSEEIIKKIKPFIDLGEKKSSTKLLAMLKKASDEGSKKAAKERFSGKSKNTVGKTIDVENRTPEFLQNKARTLSPPLESSNLALLQREANAGNRNAQFELAKLYDTGNKVERDRARAIAWYNSAASQGHSESQYRLAVAYIYGYGVERDSVIGERWLTTAAKQGHKVADKMLPIYLSNGTLNGSTSIVVSWYLEKAVNGDASGQFGLGYLYENGWGIKPSSREADSWYGAARGAGSGDAVRRLRHISSSLPTRAPVNTPDAPIEEAAKSTAPNVVSGTLPTPQSRFTQDGNNINSRSENRGSDTEQGSGGFFSSINFTQKSALMPIILVVFGLIMGLTVYRWMKRSNYKNSLF